MCGLLSQGMRAPMYLRTKRFRHESHLIKGCEHICDELRDLTLHCKRYPVKPVKFGQHSNKVEKIIFDP